MSAGSCRLIVILRVRRCHRCRLLDLVRFGQRPLRCLLLGSSRECETRVVLALSFTGVRNDDERDEDSPQRSQLTCASFHLTGSLRVYLSVHLSVRLVRVILKLLFLCRSRIFLFTCRSRAATSRLSLYCGHAQSTQW